MKRVKKLTVVQAIDSGVFAVSKETPTGSTSIGRLNFDQVVAILEKYFMFNDDSDFKKFDEIWAVIDDFEKVKSSLKIWMEDEPSESREDEKK